MGLNFQIAPFKMRKIYTAKRNPLGKFDSGPKLNPTYSNSLFGFKLAIIILCKNQIKWYSHEVLPPVVKILKYPL